MKTLINGKVLDLVSKEKKDDPTVKYNTLVVYEPGKEYPELIKLNVSNNEYASARALVGSDASIEADVTVYSSGKVSMKYVQGKALAARAAA